MNHPLKLGGILFVITAICVGILGAVNQITKPIIIANELKTEEEAMKKLITNAESFVTLDKVQDETVKKVCVAKSGVDTVGYVLRMEPSGYGGAIKMLIGIDTEGKVQGLSILEHSETPGFGANATKQYFKDQFVDRKTPLSVTKGVPGENEIQAITGATITSTAVTSAVNAASEYVLAHQAEWGDVQ